MTTYTYRCLDCNEITEVQHPMGTSPRVLCEFCDGETRRIVIVFPQVKFDWKSYSTADDGMRMTLHASKPGVSTPIDQAARGRI